jgi:hypothetical protein
MVASSPSASRKLPPSERDFQVYRLFVIEGCSTYEAAECFKISQTRVRQVQRKVVDWAAEVLPPETEVKTENLLRVRQIAASERLQQAYADAIEQWRLTNQPRYLSAVLRIVQRTRQRLPRGPRRRKWRRERAPRQNEVQTTRLQRRSPRRRTAQPIRSRSRASPSRRVRRRT